MNIENIAPRFHGREQQDAHEFLVFLLDGLHEDFNSGNRRRYRGKKTGQTDDEVKCIEGGIGILPYGGVSHDI